MIRNLNPYAGYRESGSPWNVPQHWLRRPVWKVVTSYPRSSRGVFRVRSEPPMA